MTAGACIILGLVAGWLYKRHDERVWRMRYLQAAEAYREQVGRPIDADWLIGFTGSLRRRPLNRFGEVVPIR